MVAAKPTIPIWNTADSLYANVVCALPFMDGIGTVASDLSGQGRSGTLTAGATWFNDPTLGVVVQLDGTSGYVTLSSLLNAAVLASPFSGAVSLSMWLRLRTSTPVVSTKTGLMDLGALSVPGSASKWPAGGSFGGETNGNGYINVFRSTSRILIGSLAATDKTLWHHVVITNQAGGSWKLYLNGVLFFTAVAEGALSMSLAPILGRSTEPGGGGPFFLDGWLGDFRVYDRVLLATEALSLFNSPWNLYTVTAPAGQARLIATMVDVPPGRSSLVSARGAVLTADATPVGPYASRALAFMVDAVSYLDPQTPVAPPNNPGSTPFAMTDAFNPRLKPKNSGPPALNADPVNTGTKLALPFTEGAGVTANDRSGNANHGTLTGTAAWNTSLSSFFFPDRIKAPGVLLSTGAGANYVRVTDALSLRPPSFVSVAAWLRPRGFPSSLAMILAKWANAGTIISYGLFVNTSGQFQFRIHDTIDGAATLTAPTAFSNAQQTVPFFVVGTYDGAVMSIYVNGVLAATIANSGSIQYTASQDLFIGGDIFGSGNVNASLDAIQVWDRALSLAEIRQLYSQQYPGLAPSGVPVLNSGSGAFGNYSTGALADTTVLMVDAVSFNQASSARALALMVDATPMPPMGVRSLALMVDAIPAIQNAAGLGIGSILPNFGSFAGGTAVTIKGQYFRLVTAVYVGGALCTSVVVVDETTITAVTGSHSNGVADVRVDSSTFGTVIAQSLYQYVGGLITPPANALLRGKQFALTMWNQDPPGGFYSGETAPLAVDTTLSFILSDKPVFPQAVEVYVRRTGETGYGRMRYLIDYDVVISTRRIIWKGATAAFAVVPADEIVVAYPGQG